MRFAAFVALLLLAAFPSVAAANQASCDPDYTKVTENKEYIFVMLALDDPSGATCQNRDEDIRQKYPHSGLYRNDGSNTPVWTVDWYASVAVSSDGMHIVRWGPFAPAGHFWQLALAFYEEGRELKRYSVEQLVTFPALLPHSEGNYTWLHEAEYDDNASRLTIATEHAERYEFDIKTGDVVSNWVPPVPRWMVLASAVVVLVISLLVLGLLHRRTLRERPAQDKPRPTPRRPIAPGTHRT
jgi:hypothetical protein